MEEKIVSNETPLEEDANYEAGNYRTVYGERALHNAVKDFLSGNLSGRVGRRILEILSL